MRAVGEPLAGGGLIATSTALLVATNYAWATVSIDEHGVVSNRRGFVWVTQYALPRESVYVAESHSVSWFRGKSVGLLCLEIHDSRPARLWAPLTETFVLHRIATASKAQ